MSKRHYNLTVTIPEETESTKRARVKQEEDDKCAICLADEMVDPATVDHCIHRFCFGCIQHWTTVGNASCPMCKQEIGCIDSQEQGSVVLNRSPCSSCGNKISDVELCAPCLECDELAHDECLTRNGICNHCALSLLQCDACSDPIPSFSSLRCNSCEAGGFFHLTCLEEIRPGYFLCQACLDEPQCSACGEPVHEEEDYGCDSCQTGVFHADCLHEDMCKDCHQKQTQCMECKKPTTHDSSMECPGSCERQFHPTCLRFGGQIRPCSDCLTQLEEKQEEREEEQRNQREVRDVEYDIRILDAISASEDVHWEWRTIDRQECDDPLHWRAKELNWTQRLVDQEF